MTEQAALGMPIAARVRSYFSDTAGAAARFLAKSDGPRVGALDGALAAIESNMGEAWRETVVVLVTEFGRTARLNGNDGTDHGTATVALLTGGALKGGRVIADWPGLKEADLRDNRDLRPTTDLRAVLKGLTEEHLCADTGKLEAAVFPDSGDVKPLRGLLA